MNKKKLKIVFLDFDDIKNPLLGAGQAKATLEVGKRLAEKGHNLTIISSCYPGYLDRYENGMHYKHIGLGSKNIKLNNLIYILLLPFYVRKIKADIIIECFTAPVSTLMSPLWTKVPVVGVPTSFEADRFTKLYKLPFDKIEKFGMKFYKFFLPYTKFMEEKFKKINPDVITKIIPEGVEKEFFKIKKSKPKHILYIGRYDMSQKGLDLLLEAYSKIKNQIKYPLVIAGKGNDEKKINSLINKLNLESKVKVMGAAFGSLKSKLLSESLFVVMPSRHEGFSLFALEALASANPIVAFDIPGFSWINSEVVFKAKPYDVNHYSRLILEAEKSVIKNGIAKKSREFARRYSWDSVADKYENFIHKIIN